MRLHHVLAEYQDRVHLRIRPFPLEVMGGEAAPRRVLEQEWWLAALQEPLAEFKPFESDDWPTTTLPAFEAAWCAAEQSESVFLQFDLRVRRAFFAESRNIGKREVLLDLASELALDMDRFIRDFDGSRARDAVLAEAHLGQKRYHVRGTPTLMLPDGTRLRAPIAFPRMREHHIVGVTPLPCHGDECLQATRELLNRALTGSSDT